MSRIRFPHRHAKAAALGITVEAVRQRELAERRRQERHLPRRKPPTWIGERITPPLEPDHPVALAKALRP